MLDLQLAFRNFSPDIDIVEPSVDSDFITDFLCPYFQDLPREQLAAKVAEIIAFEQARQIFAMRRR
jgi:hypothetical protein